MTVLLGDGTDRRSATVPDRAPFYTGLALVRYLLARPAF